jgi:hypothetical protein
MDLNNLLVYPQNTPHDNVVIVADTKGLLALKETIDAALNTGKEVRDFIIPMDGESYTLTIVKSDNNIFDVLPVPYTEEGYKEPDFSCWSVLFNLVD